MYISRLKVCGNKLQILHTLILRTNYVTNIATVIIKSGNLSLINLGLFFREIVLSIKGKGKGKIHPTTGHEGPEVEQMYSFTLPSTSALDEGGWPTPRPGRFTPRKDRVPIV
jgi:hypothetical protein